MEDCEGWKGFSYTAIQGKEEIEVDDSTANQTFGKQQSEIYVAYDPARNGRDHGSSQL